MEQGNERQRERLNQLERNALRYVQLQYFFKDLGEEFSLTTHLDQFLSIIKGLMGGDPSLLLDENGQWLRYSSEKGTSDYWEFVQPLLTKHLDQMKLNESSLILNDPNNPQIRPLFRNSDFTSLLLLKLTQFPSMVLEVRDIRVTQPLTKIEQEILDFINPLKLSLKYAIQTETLRRRDMERSLLLDVLVHDIRNYLTNSETTVELLSELRSEVKHPHEDLLSILGRQISGASSLVKRVQTFLLADSEKELNEVRLVEVLEETKMSLLSQYKSKLRDDESITITLVEGGYPEDPTILADSLLTDLFHNIMSNSVKYTGKEVKRIDVSWNIWNQNPSYIHITFTDWGEGIPDERKPRLMMRFETTSTKMDSLGLGLNIVIRLVERYQGLFWLSNRVMNDHRKGTVVNLCLKLVGEAGSTTQ